MFLEKILLLGHNSWMPAWLTSGRGVYDVRGILDNDVLCHSILPRCVGREGVGESEMCCDVELMWLVTPHQLCVCLSVPPDKKRAHKIK